MKIRAEKAVDVMLAVDLVVMAHRNEYDTAYLLSVDGDYTHAVKVAGEQRRKVFAVASTYGAQLKAVMYKYIHLDAAWFKDCYK